MVRQAIRHCVTSWIDLKHKTVSFTVRLRTPNRIFVKYFNHIQSTSMGLSLIQFKRTSSKFTDEHIYGLVSNKLMMYNMRHRSSRVVWYVARFPCLTFTITLRFRQASLLSNRLWLTRDVRITEEQSGIWRHVVHIQMSTIVLLLLWYILCVLTPRPKSTEDASPLSLLTSGWISICHKAALKRVKSEDRGPACVQTQLWC